MIKIRFSKWSKYNPRSDVKKGSWFRMQNDFFTNPQFFDFSVEEKLGFIYLITLRAGAEFDSVPVSFPHAEKIGGIKEPVLRSTIQKLEQLEILTVDVTSADANGTDKYATDRQTDTTDRQTETDVTSTTASGRERTPKPISSVESFERQRKFNFRALLDRYPRKQKSAQSLTALANLISDQETYDDMATAIDHYRAYVERNRTPFDFQLAFPNFLNEWRDWLDPNNGTSDFDPDSGEGTLNAEMIGRALAACRSDWELNEAVTEILSQADSAASKSKYESIIKNWKRDQGRGAQGPKKGDK